MIPIPPNSIELLPEEQSILRDCYKELRDAQAKAEAVSSKINVVMAVIGARATGHIDPAGYALDALFRAITPKSAAVPQA